jgi:flagellar hook-basal body complex protein FliE
MDVAQDMKNRMPFAALLGIELKEAGKERVLAELRVREELCTSNSILHGGAVMAYIGEVVTAVANAEATLQTVAALRDRVVAAYQEIIRMPI